MKKLSVIVPCYNEEAVLPAFYDEMTAVADGCSNYEYELLFVNDGSRDETPKKLRKLFEENKDVKIKVVNFSRNFGKEAAMYAGFTEAKGEYVTIIDADLQQDPSYAVQMGRILDENPDCDMVAAFQEKRKEGKLITACKTMFYKAINKVTEVDFISDASDFRTMRRSVVDTILALPEYHRFSKGIFSWVGYNTVAIPYDVKERESGETKWNFMKLLKYALDGIVSYTDMPLKLPLYFGGIMGVLSVVLFAVILLMDIFAVTFSAAAGYLAALVLFVGAVICVFLGITGYYVGKIHTQVKERPIFIAKEILTYEKD